MSKKPLTIAISKGYLWREAMTLFTKLGVRFIDDLEKSRKLSTTDTQGQIEVFMIRPWDVPTYVEQGAAHLGIAGKDVLIETEPKILELLDLEFGKCSLVLAGPQGSKKAGLSHYLRIATKYPHSTETYFRNLGLKVELLKLYGAVELAPQTKLSHLICDLTATGNTLRENKLEIIDTLYTSTARLIANPVHYKVHHDRISQWVTKLESKR